MYKTQKIKIYIFNNGIFWFPYKSLIFIFYKTIRPISHVYFRTTRGTSINWSICLIKFIKNSKKFFFDCVLVRTLKGAYCTHTYTLSHGCMCTLIRVSVIFGRILHTHTHVHEMMMMFIFLCM